MEKTINLKSGDVVIYKQQPRIVAFVNDDGNVYFNDNDAPSIVAHKSQIRPFTKDDICDFLFTPDFEYSSAFDKIVGIAD